MAKKKENPLKGINPMQQTVLSSAGIETSQEVVSKDQQPEQSESVKVPWERFAFICSSELVEKVKIIAHKEGFTIRALMEYMMQQGIESYEAKHGVVHTYTKRTPSDIM